MSVKQFLACVSVDSVSTLSVHTPVTVTKDYDAIFTLVSVKVCLSVCLSVCLTPIKFLAFCLRVMRLKSFLHIFLI